MKKVTLFVFSLMLVFVSCSKEEKDNPDIVSKTVLPIPEYPVEIETLTNFNDSLFQLHPYTRGWLDYLYIVSADVIGAYEGFKACSAIAATITAATGGTGGPVALVGTLAGAGLVGAGSSYGAYKASCTYVMPAEQFYQYQLDEMLSQKTIIGNNINIFNRKTNGLLKGGLNEIVLPDEVLTLVADLHDSIVCSTLATVVTRTSLQPDVDEIENKPVMTISEYQVPMFSDEELVNVSHATNNVLIGYYKTADYKTTVEEMINKGMSDEGVGNILILFLDALNNYVTNESTLMQILDEYRHVIRTSENMSIEDKNLLLLTFAVAENSCKLWENRTN